MSDIFDLVTESNMAQVEANLRATDAVRNKYRFSRCVDRNVVFIGRSRTGKTTVAKMLGNIFYRPGIGTLYSETQGVEFYKVATDNIDGSRIFFNIVDTPGFFELSTTGNVNSNERIKKFVDGCIKHDVTNVHMFAFVFSLSGRINDQDILTMKFVKTNYPNIGKYMALIVTHCESLTQQQRQALIDEFWLHPEVRNSKLQEFFSQGVFYMGCFKHESFDQKNEAAIYAEYRNILEMRTTFIEKCLNCENTYNVHKEGASCRIL